MLPPAAACLLHHGGSGEPLLLPGAGEQGSEGSLGEQESTSSQPPSNKLDIAKFDLRMTTLLEDLSTGVAGSKAASDQKTSRAVVFAHPSNPRSEIPPDTIISKLVHLDSQSPAVSLLLKPRPTPPTPGDTIESPLVISDDSIPSFLELFIQEDGHQPLARCLPSLYPYHWPEKLSNDQGAPQQPGTKAHSLLHTPISLPFHSTVMLGLGLRLSCYGNVLRENPKVAYILLKLLMGAEVKGKSLSITDKHRICFAGFYRVFSCLRVPQIPFRNQRLSSSPSFPTSCCSSASGSTPQPQRGRGTPGADPSGRHDTPDAPLPLAEWAPPLQGQSGGPHHR